MNHYVAVHLPAIEVVSDKDLDGVILGRNLLNQLSLLIDDKRLETRLMVRTYCQSKPAYRS